MVNRLKIPRHVLLVIGMIFGWFRSIPIHPELGITAMLGNQGAIRVVFIASF